MTLFICPAGTSIGGTPRKAGESEGEYAARIEAKIEGDRTKTRAAHADAEAARRNFLYKVSAEAHGLCRHGCGADDRVLLLASDTDDGEQAANRLKALIEDEFAAETTVVRIPGLSVHAGGAFRQAGIANLIRKVRAATEANTRGRTIFNVSGGYKGVVPYMTLLGMLLEVETIYVFEQSDLLIRLPPLPLRFDEVELGPLVPALALLADHGVMRRADFDARLPPGRRRDGDPLLHMLIDDDGDGNVALTAAGELAADALAGDLPLNTIELHRRALDGDGHGDPTADRDLARMRLPGQLDVPRHAETYANLRGLKVWKPGNNAVRIVYWIEGETVKVAEIFNRAAHRWDAYRDGDHAREDYAPGPFTAWPAAGAAPALSGPAARVGAELAAWLARMQEDLHAAESRAAAAEARLAEIAKLLTRALAAAATPTPPP